MKDITHKTLYTTLNSQVYSSNGKYLFVASNFSDIATFSIGKITSCIENITNEQITDPVAVFRCSEKIFSLAYHREFLIVGSTGSIVGYSISSSGLIQKKAWSIQLPLRPERCEMSEVNDMWVDVENDLVYAGCGDNCIYICSLEDGNFIKKLTGHTDYIHSVNGHEKSLISASEDGSVKFWDQRENSDAYWTLEPYKNANINRQSFGSWIGSASINKEWAAMGGGPRLALYHLRNRQPFQIFDFPKEIHVTDFIEDNLLAAGESNILSQYSFKGDIISEIKTSGPCILSVAWQKSTHKILTACGASNIIDVSTNFTYKDTTLNFYVKAR